MQVTPGCYVGHTQQVRACGARRRGCWTGHIQRRYFNNNTAIKARKREDAEVLQVRRLRVGEQAEPLCSNHDIFLRIDNRFSLRLWNEDGQQTVRTNLSALAVCGFYCENSEPEAASQPKLNFQARCYATSERFVQLKYERAFCTTHVRRGTLFFHFFLKLGQASKTLIPMSNEGAWRRFQL
jgi:hypothetical protein